MSAFVVTTETMNHVLDAINQQYKDHGGFFAGMSMSECSDLDKIGEALFDLNCAAVDQRYNETNDRPAYKCHLRYSTAYEHYRAIGCLLYQCSEGNIQERPLYKALDELHDRIAHKIADGVVESKKLPWDFPDEPAAARRVFLTSLI